MNTNTLSRLWVAEYNPIDQNYHIQPLLKTIEFNLVCIAENRTHDYLIFGIFDTHDEASACCDLLSAKLKGMRVQ